MPPDGIGCEFADIHRRQRIGRPADRHQSESDDFPVGCQTVHVILRPGFVRRDQANTEKSAWVNIQAVTEVGVVLEAGAAYLHEHRLIHLAGLHLRQQLLRRFLAVGWELVAGLARKLR